MSDSNLYGDIDVSVTATTDQNALTEQSIIDVHLDDVDDRDFEKTDIPRIHIWGNEDDRMDELESAINNFRSEYIFATGIVLPESIRDLTPLSEDEISSLMWVAQLELIEDENDARKIITHHRATDEHT